MVLMWGAMGGQDAHWQQQDDPDVPGYASSGKNVRLVQKLVGEEQVTEKSGGEDKEWGDKGRQVEVDWTVPNYQLLELGILSWGQWLHHN